MPRVTHDFFVWHAITVSRPHKSGAQSMRTDRFGQSALQSRFDSALEQDLPHRVRAQPGLFHHTATVDLAKKRTAGDFGQLQPSVQSRNRTSVGRLAARDSDLRAFAFSIGL
jgi:hypothetical protein